MKIRFNKYFLGMGISAAVAFWGFASINSWFVNNHGISNVWCVILGIAGIGGIGYFWWRLNQTTGGGKEQR